MSEENNQQKQAAAFASANLRLTSVAGQVGCITLLIVFIALFLGIYLDRVFGTRPVLLIIFVLGSAPLSLYLTYKIALRAIAKVNATKVVNETEQNAKGEKKGD
ncbi:MAG: AtpZ/AtpI family protein [Anaerolineales bacterium]